MDLRVVKYVESIRQKDGFYYDPNNDDSMFIQTYQALKILNNEEVSIPNKESIQQKVISILSSNNTNISYDNVDNYIIYIRILNETGTPNELLQDKILSRLRTVKKELELSIPNERNVFNYTNMLVELDEISKLLNENINREVFSKIDLRILEILEKSSGYYMLYELTRIAITNDINFDVSTLVNMPKLTNDIIYLQQRKGGNSMSLNILIVEDNNVLRNTFALYIKNISDVNKVLTANNSDEMFEALNNNDINALIIDIDLGKDSLDGVTAYALCRECGYNIPAIIITGSKVEAHQAFDIGVVDFLSKASLGDLKRLNKAIHKLKLFREWNLFHENKGIIVPINGDLNLTVYPSEIKYITSLNGIVYVHTTRREDGFLTHLKLNFYQDILESVGFIVPHRSFVVNSAFIKEKHNDHLKMLNGELIPISSHRQDYVDKHLLKTGGFTLKSNDSSMLSKFISMTKGLLFADKGGI